MKRTDEQIKQSKYEHRMKTIDLYAGYYRANPHRFVKEYLGIGYLKIFQEILLYLMMIYPNFYWVACRGLGKTFLTALFCCVRAILFPKSKIVVASATFKQAKEIVLKIRDELMPSSPMLAAEIEKIQTGQNDTYIFFRNHSWIRVVCANDNARGARSNVLVIDESRMVPQRIFDTVLRPFNAAPRQPGFLSKPKYADRRDEYLEPNKELFLSSAWYESSEMYDKVKDYMVNMLSGKGEYFLCDFPYQLSIREGLLMKSQIEREMSEATFNPITFMMEREGKFYGSGEDSLFNYKLLSARRVLKDALQPLSYYRSRNIQPPEKEAGELRVLSVDIALLASKKHDNDASALIITRNMPTENCNYISNVSYIETAEGLITDELGLLVMRTYYQFDCDRIVIDGNGNGQSIVDFMLTDRYDPLYGCTYSALNVCNNDEIAERCKEPNAQKVIYVIKANAKSNNDMALALRAAIQNGQINLLYSDTDIEAYLADNISGYKRLSELEKDSLLVPYVQTSLLINELINLRHYINNGLVKVVEPYGMRKDRYSSLEYNYYAVQQEAHDLKPKNNDIYSLLDKLTIKKARY